MKGMFESSEAFTAYATIEAGYWMSSEAQQRYSEFSSKRKPIEQAIDKATSYDKHREKEFAEYVLICMEDIIEAKKFIGADYAEDMKVVSETKKLLEKLKENGK